MKKDMLLVIGFFAVALVALIVLSKIM